MAPASPQGGERVAPAHRLGQRGEQVGADVVEGGGGDRGVGAGGGGELGLLEDLLVAGDRRLHQRRVEGARDRQADRLGALGAQRLAGFADLLGVAGEDHLAGGVVVGDRQLEFAGDFLDDLVGAAERGDHAAGTDLRGLVHQAAADRGEAQAGARRQGARGDQGRELAERVAGVEGRVRLAGRLPVGERRR